MDVFKLTPFSVDLTKNNIRQKHDETGITRKTQGKRCSRCSSRAMLNIFDELHKTCQTCSFLSTRDARVVKISVTIASRWRSESKVWFKASAGGKSWDMTAEQKGTGGISSDIAKQYSV